MCHDWIPVAEVRIGLYRFLSIWLWLQHSPLKDLSTFVEFLSFWFISKSKNKTYGTSHWYASSLRFSPKFYHGQKLLACWPIPRDYIYGKDASRILVSYVRLMQLLGWRRPETLFYIAGLVQFQGSTRLEVQWSLRMFQILPKSVISGLVQP